LRAAEVKDTKRKRALGKTVRGRVSGRRHFIARYKTRCFADDRPGISDESHTERRRGQAGEQSQSRGRDSGLREARGPDCRPG
jgi:hypothetical protein